MQQGFAGTNPLFVIVSPADGREHTWKRCLGIGAASSDVAEVEHVQCLHLWRGLPQIAVETPARRPERLPHHDEHQRWLAALHCWGNARIHPYRRAHDRYLSVGGQHPRRGIEQIGRCDEVAQLLLVPHQRRKVLEDKQQRNHQDQSSPDNEQQSTQQGASEGVCHHAHPPYARDGYQGIGEHMQQQACRQQLASLSRICTQNVAQHARVVVDTVALHEEGGECCGQNKRGQERSHDPTICQQAKDEGMKCNQRQHQGSREQPGSRVSPVAASCAGRQERGVAQQCEVCAYPQHQAMGSNTRSPICPVQQVLAHERKVGRVAPPCLVHLALRC